MPEVKEKDWLAEFWKWFTTYQPPLRGRQPGARQPGMPGYTGEFPPSGYTPKQPFKTILTDEERFGVKFDVPYEGSMTLPDGSITSKNWWLNLTDEEKNQYTPTYQAWAKKYGQPSAEKVPPLTPDEQLRREEFKWRVAQSLKAEEAGREAQQQAIMEGVADFERKKYLMQLQQQLNRPSPGKSVYEELLSELTPAIKERGGFLSPEGSQYYSETMPGLAAGRGIGYETPETRVQRGRINQQLQASFGKGLSKIVEPKAPAMWTGGEYSPIFQGETAYQPVELSGETATGRGWRQSNERVAMMQELAGQFEQARAEILSTTAPRDWIIRAKAERAVNPYSVVGTPAGTVGDPMTRYYAQLREQVAPEVPQDLTKFLGAGTTQQKFGTEIAPPSGQAWAQAPWETQQRLFGYAEGLGGEGGATNLLEEMRRRLPYNPSRGARWSPASQR